MTTGVAGTILSILERQLSRADPASLGSVEVLFTFFGIPDTPGLPGASSLVSHVVGSVGQLTELQTKMLKPRASSVLSSAA